MMKEPRELLRKSTLAAAIATTLTAVALSGCFVQSSKPENEQSVKEAPAGKDDPQDQAASDTPDTDLTEAGGEQTAKEEAASQADQEDAPADITITVTPEKAEQPSQVATEQDQTTPEQPIDATASAESVADAKEVSDVETAADATVESKDQADETAAAKKADEPTPDTDTIAKAAEQSASAESPAEQTVQAVDQNQVKDTSAETAHDAVKDTAQATEAKIESTSDVAPTDPPVKETASTEEPAPEPEEVAILYLCDEIGNKLGSVSVDDCLNVELADSGARSRMDRSLAVKEYLHAGEDKTGRVLLMGGIHGDEFSSVSIIFKWLKFIEQDQASEFTWQVVPLLNPDGLLRKKSQRQNDAGVDLNRNFPSPDWEADAHRYWTNRTGSNPRRYPGPDAASEPETKWFIETIENFNPDAIVAVHAPHSLVDYDGPQQPPHRLGKLRLHELGIYPGSLGNYAGVYKNIPVVTIELPSAGIMPTRQDISQMWLDLVEWLHREVPKQKLARLEKDEQPTSQELPEVDSLH